MGTAALRWRPAPFIKATVGVHVAGAALIALEPAAWPWVLGAIGANQAVLSTVGIFPKSTLLGPNMRRLPSAAVARREIALTFDDGPDPEVTPRVLDLLDAYGARASFFCIGKRVRAHPEIVIEITRRGHSVENHSARHPLAFAFYGPAALRAEVEPTQAEIAALVGRAPRFFRAPFGIRSPMLEPVLARLDLQLVSWTRRGIDTVASNPAQVESRLATGLAAGDILLLHDGLAARTIGGNPIVLKVLPRLLDRLAASGLNSVSLPTGCDVRAPQARAA